MPSEQELISQLQNEPDTDFDTSGDVSTVADDTVSQVEPTVTESDDPAPVTVDSPSPSSTPGFRDRFKQKYGIDLSSKYQTDEQAEYGLANAFQLVGKRDQDAEVGRLLRDNPAVVIDHLRQSYPDAFGQPAPQQAKQNGAPEWDDEWVNQVEKNADGHIIAKAGVDPAVATKFNKYARWYEKRQRDLTNNFESLVEEKARTIAREEAEKIAQQTFQQGFGQHAQAAKAAGWFEQNKSWMFSGGDYQQGYTPEGRAYANHVLYAGTPVEQGGLGIADMDAQIRYANGMMPKKPTNGKQRQQATRQPSVAGATNGRADERREGEDPLAYGLRMLKKAGLDKE